MCLSTIQMATCSDDDDLIVSCAVTAIVTAVIRRRRLRRDQHRRTLWCKPWLLQRSSERGIRSFVNNELADVSSDFYGFLRMPPEVFHELLLLVKPLIERQDSIMRDSITAEDMLIVTLRYLASGTCLPTRPVRIAQQKSNLGFNDSVTFH